MSKDQNLKANNHRKYLMVGTTLLLTAVLWYKNVSSAKSKSADISDIPEKSCVKPEEKAVDDVKRKQKINRHKVGRDGSWRPYPGNRVVSFLTVEGDDRVMIESIYEALKTSAIGEFVTFLPPSSYHVTICEGVLMNTRPNERSKLFKTDDLETITKKMWEKGKSILNDLQGVELCFRVRKIILVERVLTVLLHPLEGSVNECKEKLLKKWHLSRRYRYKDGYQMTLGYRWRRLPMSRRESLRLDYEGILKVGTVLKFGPPMLCTHSTVDQLEPYTGKE